MTATIEVNKFKQQSCFDLNFNTVSANMNTYYKLQLLEVNEKIPAGFTKFDYIHK